MNSARAATANMMTNMIKTESVIFFAFVDVYKRQAEMSVIVKTDLEFVREKLKSPFGFKGRYLDELWQTVALVATERHTRCV